MARWGLALVVAVFGLWLSGCAGTKGQFADLQEQGEAPKQPSILDTLQVGEAITITFSDLPAPIPPTEERVKEDGTITLLQNQTFIAAGKTRRELEQEIRERYVPKYYVNMTVSVKQQENTRFYFVDGEVKAPGRQVYLGEMSVLKAIASCGGVTDFSNRRKVRLIRANGKIEIVNALKALEDPSLDLRVYPGDRVVVPRSIW
jgi:polysaccharide export outer membrane protein